MSEEQRWTHEELADVARKAAAVAAHTAQESDELSAEEWMRRITVDPENVEVALEVSRLPYFQRVFRRALERKMEERRIKAAHFVETMRRAGLLKQEEV